MKTVFTTGDVSRICKVAPRTVSKWFDSGRLKGYRVPGSSDNRRRIPRESLLAFLKEHGLPTDAFNDEAYHKILFVGAESLFVERLQALLPEKEGYRYEVTHSGFEAGVAAEYCHPDIIILDLAMGRGECLQIAQNVKRNEAYAETRLIALASEDETDDLTRFGFSVAFKKPFDVALVAERIRASVLEVVE
jgi:two-component system response regulator RpaA